MNHTTAIITLIIALFSTTAASGANDAAAWKARIAQAAPGSTVALPAGTFALADVTVPAGVTLTGAGYRETILDASGGVNGLILSERSAVRGLTVRGAPATGIVAQTAPNARLAAVRVERCLSGVVLAQADGVRIENCVFFANRTGLAAAGSAGLCVVNNTFDNNHSLGLSLTGIKDTAVFNNVVANSATASYLADNAGLELDYNLYLANYIGKIPGHPGPISVQGWRDLTGHDAHSLQHVIALVNPADGVFAPATRLDWAPGRSPVSGFGVAQLGRFNAPADDVLGAARGKVFDLGAVAAPVEQGRSAAGSLNVRQDDAVVSAGLFTTDGVLVNYLFHNLPLPRGRHEFWLPARDWQGRPIAPGNYEVRAVESKARMRYQGLVFNTARSSAHRDHASLAMQYAAFTPDGRLVLGCNWSESGLQVRSFDANYEQAGWFVTGTSNLSGLGLDGVDHLYLLTQVGADKASGHFSLALMKIALADGAVQPITSDQPAPRFTGLFSEKTDGLAVLGGRFYVSDPATNRVFHTAVTAPRFAESFALTSPRQIVADRQHNLLWLISGRDTVLALTPEGQTVHRQTFPHSLDRLSVANRRLALLSRETGKIEVFRIETPQKLTPIRTLGTGEAPSGKFRADEFTFKGGATPCGVTLSDQGDLLVMDWPRTLLFGEDGSLKKQTIAVWGQHLVQGKLAGDTQPRWWNVDASYSITMDSRDGSWAPDGYWSYAQPNLNRFRTAVDFFSDQGRNFALFKQGDWSTPSFMLIEFDRQYHGRTLAHWQFHRATQGALVRFTDRNQDGVINSADAPGEPVLRADGKPVMLTNADHLYLDPVTHDLWLAGSQYGPAAIGQCIRYRGLDALRIPAWDWAGAHTIECRMSPTGTNVFVSPFDWQTEERINANVGEFNTFRDGTVVFSTVTKSGGGAGMGHVAGSDLAAAGPAGSFRWFHPLPLTAGIHGVQVVDDILITQDFTDMDWYLINRDGLGLGISGIPPAMHWTGMWNDHPKQYRLFRGNDGGAYAVLGDYTVTGFHQFKLEGADTIRTQQIALRVDAPAAAALAARPPRPVPARVEPPRFEVAIRKLAAPLSINGDLQKWHTAGIQPQIIVTPETAGGNVTGPGDISGLVRLAHENGNLYVQVIKFDDVVTMHQPLAKHYMQDSVEVCLNGFLSGFKFNVTRTQEHGETVFRDRFFHTEFNRVYTPAEVPRAIVVLDDARAVGERVLIESIYGVDLSRSRVIVTEFILPLALAFAGDPKAGPAGQSGDTMWIGFMLDDNDVPGSDVQDLLVYPATYSTFAVKERGCLATFE